MGQKFADCDTLTKRKNMSLSIRQATIAAFTELLEKVEQEYDTYGSCTRKTGSDSCRCARSCSAAMI